MQNVRGGVNFCCLWWTTAVDNRAKIRYTSFRSYFYFSFTLFTF